VSATWNHDRRDHDGGDRGHGAMRNRRMRRGVGAGLLTPAPDRSVGLDDLLLYPSLIELVAERGDRLPDLLACGSMSARTSSMPESVCLVKCRFQEERTGQRPTRHPVTSAGS